MNCLLENLWLKYFQQQQQHDPVNKLDDEKSQSMKELISNNTIESDSTGFRLGKKQISTDRHYVKVRKSKANHLKMIPPVFRRTVTPRGTNRGKSFYFPKTPPKKR